MSEQIMWTIKRPDGTLFMTLISSRRRFAIQEFVTWYGEWAPRYREGYRCIRVKVQEVGDA
jgi:hypothetical protein